MLFRSYDVKDRKLIVNEAEAEVIRRIFERFAKLGSTTLLARELSAAGVTGKRGKIVDKGYLHKVLHRRVYIGEAEHKGASYPGEHAPIISRELWDKVHAINQKPPRTRAGDVRSQTPALLKGLMFGADGRAMTPTFSAKAGRK